MDSITLEQVIKENIKLPPASNQGWCQVLCKVCNDRGHKGKRAAFIFDNDGSVGYHCFNCSIKAKYDPKESKRVSKNMREILNAFGVTEDMYKGIYLSQLVDQEKGKKGTSAKADLKHLEPTEIPLPKHFYPLKSAAPDDKWSIIAKDYLERRLVDPNAHNYMLSTARKTGIAEIDKWYGRLIIPIYKDDKLVYYQGRALYNAKKKYQSVNIRKDNVIYGFDKLFDGTDAPLLVCEGFFDALQINGVALLGNRLSTEQAEWLAKSRKKKIYIPDASGKGDLVAREFVKQGWSVSIPEFFSNGGYKDITDAVIKYGRLFVMSSIMKAVYSGFEAETQINLFIK